MREKSLRVIKTKEEVVEESNRNLEIRELKGNTMRMTTNRTINKTIKDLLEDNKMLSHKGTILTDKEVLDINKNIKNILKKDSL